MEAIRPHLDTARAEAIRWLGDWHPLVRQIAPGEGVAQTPSFTAAQATTSAAALHAFLHEYKRTVLLPFELPAVMLACTHTQRNQMKELIALDQTLSCESWLKPYEQDSQAAGRLHLERLKPLRDQRGLQRYIAAVEDGRAYGWHLLVAGAALGLYSLPLRQGLMDYALHTFWDVVGRAAGPLGLEPDEVILLVNELGADLPQQIQTLLPPTKLEAL